MPARKKIKTPPLSDLLPTDQMAAYSKRSRRTLYRWRDEGRITGYYIGHQLMWSKSEVDGLVTTRQPEGVAKSVAAMRAALPGGDAA